MREIKEYYFPTWEIQIALEQYIEKQYKYPVRVFLPEMTPSLNINYEKVEEEE